MDIKLSKDADALICLIYKDYLSKRKNGVAKSEAKRLGGSNNIRESISPKLSKEDIDDICRELDRAGLMKCFYASDSVCFASLSDNGIVYMGNRFKAGIESVIDYIAKIKSMIPFI